MCRGKYGLQIKFLGCFIVLVVIVIIFCLLNRENDSFKCTFKGSLKEAQTAIKVITQCSNNFAHYEFQKRKDGFVVLHNYVMATQRFNCEESVTYVTHGDYTFLNNLVHIVDRWKGPVSIALHAPGSDLPPTLDSIKYLRNCVKGIKEFVTFHIYFNETYQFEEIPSHVSMQEATFDCSLPAPYKKVNRKELFVSQNGMVYPINVGRNIARSMSETHFVLVSDIELYPSSDLIPKFLKMVAECTDYIKIYTPYVFVLQVFEVQSNLEVPTNKSNLQEMLDKNLAIPFHRDICSQCHSVPKYYAWTKDEDYGGLHIFTVAKRIGRYYHWEPFYLGTKAEPIFDERLSWDGMSDKIVQAYTMCLMNYSFFVLDNAFLVHSPGIKQSDPLGKINRQKYVNATEKLLDDVIIPELTNKFKNTRGCEL